MKDHIKPLLRRNPDEIIINVGTNSLRSSNTPRECTVEMTDLAEAVSSESSQGFRFRPDAGRNVLLFDW